MRGDVPVPGAGFGGREHAHGAVGGPHRVPEGSLAAHAIGYISRINAKDEEMIEASGHSANYKGTEHIGKIGLEANYEFELHGTTGYEQVEVDAGGALEATVPAHGVEVFLREGAVRDPALREALDAAMRGARPRD